MTDHYQTNIDNKMDVVANRLDEVLEEKIDKMVEKAQELEGEDFSSDPVYSHFSLDRPEYTLIDEGSRLKDSVTRNLGTVYERGVQFAVEEQLGLDSDQYSITLTVDVDGEEKTNTLDAKIEFDDLPRDDDKERLQELVEEYAELGGFDSERDWEGFGLEIRHCFKTNDGERKKKNKRSGSKLNDRNLLPIMLIFCDCANQQALNYWEDEWVNIEGEDSYEFARKLTGYDLKDYFITKEDDIEEMMDEVFDAI